jgi:hypothetical protein
MGQEKSEQNIERLELRKKGTAGLQHKTRKEKKAKRQAKEKERIAKRLAKELEGKLRLERLKLRKKEKAELPHKRRKEKQARQEAKEREREEARRAKADLKSKQHILALKELEWRTKEKEEKKQKKLEQKNEKKRLSELDNVGKTEEHKKMNDVVRIAAETKERQKLKTFDGKREKERKKTEKENQKLKAIEEKKARKKMDLHLEEEVIKEKPSGQGERIDIFVGFDSIDKETADRLIKCGYTSIEKLREANVKDLMKIGLKKKTAQMILAESEEFVAWDVYDADEHSGRKSDTPLRI